MDTVLEATAGPLRGQRLPLPEGDLITIGRTAKSNISIPDDKFMSGVHFAVVWKGDSGRLVDRGSSNGTFVNGKKVQEAVLKIGDEIRAGDSIFVTRRGQASGTRTAGRSPLAEDTTNFPVAPKPVPHAPPAPVVSRSPAVSPAPARPLVPSPMPPSAAAGVSSPVEFTHLKGDESPVVGHWQFSSVPEGWEIVEDYGIQETVREGLASSAMVSEEILSGAMSLDDFVQFQVGRLRGFFREPRIERSNVSPVAGAEDTVAVDVRYRTKDGKAIFYRSVYVRRGDRAGILTLKTLEAELPRVKPVFDTILSGISFRDR
jgi:pSer/pThr/pTyr-binding forkhead associated (FHA) protein